MVTLPGLHADTDAHGGRSLLAPGLPTAVDWRNANGKVTSVKDQGVVFTPRDDFTNSKSQNWVRRGDALLRGCFN